MSIVLLLFVVSSSISNIYLSWDHEYMPIQACDVQDLNEDVFDENFDIVPFKIKTHVLSIVFALEVEELYKEYKIGTATPPPRIS